MTDHESGSAASKITVNWRYEASHSTEFTPKELIDFFDLEERWPEGQDLDALTVEEVIEAFHSACDERNWRIGDYLAEQSDNTTWTDGEVDLDSVEAEA